MNDAAGMLRRLEPTVRPAGAPAVARGGRTPVEARGFDALLEDARSGRLRSGRAVTLRDDAALARSIDEPALARLGDAADRAEAAGARRAAAWLDGRAILLDVAARTVVGELGAGANGTPFAEVDAVVRVPPADEVPPAPPIGPPASGPRPPIAGADRA